MEVWEPRVERVPLHAWLHPWLPMLPGPLADLYPGIRFKLAVALQQWHPSDGSAKELLSPWQTVLTPLSPVAQPHAVHRCGMCVCSAVGLPDRRSSASCSDGKQQYGLQGWYQMHALLLMLVCQWQCRCQAALSNARLVE